MLLEARCRQPLSLRRERDDSRAPVARAALPHHHIKFFERIARRGHRAVGKKTFLLDWADGERAFVQQGLQRGKIREAESRSGDALLGQAGQCAMASDNDQPEPGRGNASALFHAVLLIKQWPRDSRGKTTVGPAKLLRRRESSKTPQSPALAGGTHNPRLSVFRSS